MSNWKRSMKLTPRAMELLFELRQLESVENMQILAGDLDQMNCKLLRLYRMTKKPGSRELITELLTQVGYPWFRKFAAHRSNDNDLNDNDPNDNDLKTSLSDSAKLISKASVLPAMFNVACKQSFLDLVPQNMYFN